jgi:hypothetical protein
MSRLIDAKELEKKALTESCFDSQTEDVFLDLVDSMPTIDAEPVRHGRWELINTPSMFMRMLECSICKGRVGSTVKTNYCPNCGAKMDGGGSHA